MLGMVMDLFVQMFERHFGFFHAASLGFVTRRSRGESTRLVFTRSGFTRLKCEDAAKSVNHITFTAIDDIAIRRLELRPIAVRP